MALVLRMPVPPSQCSIGRQGLRGCLRPCRPAKLETREGVAPNLSIRSFISGSAMLALIFLLSLSVYETTKQKTISSTATTVLFLLLSAWRWFFWLPALFLRQYPLEVKLATKCRSSAPDRAKPIQLGPPKLLPAPWTTEDINACFVVKNRRLFVAVHESAFGTKRTWRSHQTMSAFEDKADIERT